MIKCLNPVTIGILWYIIFNGFNLGAVGKTVASIIAVILIVIACFLGA